MSGFEYFPERFVESVHQTKHKVDRHTTRADLFDTLINFLKGPSYPTKKFTKPWKKPIKLDEFS